MWLVRGLPKKCGSGAPDEVEGLDWVVLGSHPPTKTCHYVASRSLSRAGCGWLARGWMKWGVSGLVGAASCGRAGHWNGVHLVVERQLTSLNEQRGIVDSKNGQISTSTT